MLIPARIIIWFLVWLGSAGVSLAAAVSTERVTAPRSLEAIPGLPTPANPLKPNSDPDDTTGPAKDENAEPEDIFGPEDTTEAEDEDQPLPEVHYGEELLPAAVRQMRKDMIEAATAVDFDRLRLVYDANEAPPTLSFGETGDPIEFLKQSSGDRDGLEILAILIEVLQAGWVHKNPGEVDEMYVWPYFAEIPLDELSNKQKVELYKIATASDVEEMETFGSYIFYRVGIGPDGTWYYFVAGD